MASPTALLLGSVTTTILFPPTGLEQSHTKRLPTDPCKARSDVTLQNLHPELPVKPSPFGQDQGACCFPSRNKSTQLTKETSKRLVNKRSLTQVG